MKQYFVTLENSREGDLGYLPSDASATFCDEDRKEDAEGRYAIVSCPIENTESLEESFEADDNVLSYETIKLSGK